MTRLPGIEGAAPAERRATAWIGAMFAAAMASTFLLRPLRDQFGVDQGVARLPDLYALTLLATALAVPPFWWLANRMASRRFVPAVLHALAGALVALGIALSALGDYAWGESPAIGQWFWGGFSAFNVVLPALVWIHAVEHFGRDRANRLFGLIGVGGTLGAVAGSAAAGLLTSTLMAPPWWSALAAAALCWGALACYRCSLPYCEQLAGGSGRIAAGGLLAGLRILRSDSHARRIALYMVLLGVLATAFYAAQTELVGKDFERGRSQHAWLAHVELANQALVLVLQLFCTGRALPRLPAAALLISLPVVSIAGLGVLWLAPSAVAIAGVQAVRRGTQFAFEKPAREVLYTPLGIETQHKVKFLLDTFAFRLGDWLGAWLQLALRAVAPGPGFAVAVTAGVALGWIVLGLRIGRRQHVASS